MASYRATSLLGDRLPPGRNSPAASDVAAPVHSIIRLLLIDKNPGTSQLIENALWVWPHRIARAADVEQAVSLSRQQEPAAIVVSLDMPDAGGIGIVRILRNELPFVPIIAIGTAGQSANPRAFLEQGANAVLTRDALQRPTLHDLLSRLRNQGNEDNAPVAGMGRLMPLPWRESQIAGSLICDIKGIVTSANDCLARWLDFPAPSALVGSCVWRDILHCRTDWTAWKSVAGDLRAFQQHALRIKSRNGQRLRMLVEVYAAPSSPADIQAIFAMQTASNRSTGQVRRC